MRFLKARDLYLVLVIALIKMASWSPSSRLKELVVSGIASAAYQFSKHKRLRIEENLSKAFGPTLTDEQKRQIVKGAFYEFWKAGLSILPSRAERRAIKRVNIQGIERLHRALEDGKGVILWESQFGRRMLACQILHEKGFSLHQVHAENHLWGFGGHSSSISWVTRHVVRGAFARWEMQFVAEIIYLPRSGSLAFTRTLLRRLEQNAILCVTGDGRFGRRLIPLRFLGWTDFFSTGMVSLAKTCGAPILPVFCFHDRNDNMNLIIEGPIEIDTNLHRDRSLESSLAQYVGLLESYIRRYPEKYLQWHFPQEAREHHAQGRINER